MIRSIAGVLCLIIATSLGAQEPETSSPAETESALEERNKALARGFYQDLWFSENTDRYELYVAPEYVVHDIGDIKGEIEPAIQQKKIADFFHSNGEMTGTIDYQIAEGDLVATRWQWKFKPETLPFRLLGGRDQVPIINVFRIEDGKIVEVWNHRHDIDTGRRTMILLKGLAIGLLIGALGWIVLTLLWLRARRRARSAVMRPA